jgi:hypothetical protein
LPKHLFAGWLQGARRGPHVIAADAAFDPATSREFVVERLKPTIDYAVKTYGRTDSPVVRGRARILAARAVKTFKPSGGAKLKTYVQSQLQQLSRLAPKIVDPLPSPERWRRNSAEINTAASALRGSSSGLAMAFLRDAGNGTVDAADLSAVLGNWGGSGVGDLDGNGVVDAADLSTILGAWGACGA